MFSQNFLGKECTKLGFSNSSCPCNVRQLLAFPGLQVKGVCACADYLWSILVFLPKEGMSSNYKDRPTGKAGSPELAGLTLLRENKLQGVCVRVGEK